MFARIKKSGKYDYLQIVENQRVDSKVTQRVIATVGRMDKLSAKGEVETLIRSLSRLSEKALLVLSGKSEIQCEAKTIGPAIIFERLWCELGIQQVIRDLLHNRAFLFDVERAIFLTVLHRILISGSDRFCDKWRRDLVVKGTEDLALHQFYRAMAFLGEVLDDQEHATLSSPRCVKDVIEEKMFAGRRHLFAELDLVFFDTTSVYFHGEGGESLGRRGFSKDHRPELKQMVVGAVLDQNGRPLCCEMWPGNSTDVKTLVPVTDRIRKRFGVGRFCIVADRGMVSRETIRELEERKIAYILGTRMRKVKEITTEVLARAGRYKEVKCEGRSPLKVKEVMVRDKRYIVCLNPKQAEKDKADRDSIIESLREQIRKGPKALVGNEGYRKFLKVDKDSIHIDLDKVKEEERFDGKWVLTTNTNWSSDRVALKYKELRQVEHSFRDLKSTFETRPVFHQRDDTIRGHVFCSFLALVLRKELYRRLDRAGHAFEWSDIKQDLSALQEIVIEENGKRFALRSQCLGTCSSVFRAVGVAIPPTIRVLS